MAFDLSSAKEVGFDLSTASEKDFETDNDKLYKEYVAKLKEQNSRTPIPRFSGDLTGGLEQKLIL